MKSTRLGFRRSRGYELPGACIRSYSDARRRSKDEICYAYISRKLYSNQKFNLTKTDREQERSPSWIATGRE